MRRDPAACRMLLEEDAALPPFAKAFNFTKITDFAKVFDFDLALDYVKIIDFGNKQGGK